MSTFSSIQRRTNQEKISVASLPHKQPSVSNQDRKTSELSRLLTLHKTTFNGFISRDRQAQLLEMGASRSQLNSVKAACRTLKGGGFNRGESGEVRRDRNEALAAVQQMKRNFGNGVSTKILIENKTGADVTFCESNHSSGQFYTKPINIPNGHTLALLDVKTGGVMRGSIGSATFQKDSGEKETIKWSSPYVGTTKCSDNGEIIRDESSPTIHYELTKTPGEAEENNEVNNSVAEDQTTPGQHHKSLRTALTTTYSVVSKVTAFGKGALATAQLAGLVFGGITSMIRRPDSDVE